MQDTAVHARYRERWQAVHRELRDLIVTGALQPGQRLREQELAERFGYSRGPVREALRVLETEGLAVREAGRATFVTSIGATDVEEIFSLRLVIEPFALSRAMRISAVDLEVRLRTHLGDMTAAIHRGDETARVDEDIAFHNAIYDLAAHDRLAACWSAMRTPLRVLMTVTGSYTDPTPDGTTHDHGTIWDAVRRRDSTAATAALTGHLQVAHEVLTRHFATSEAMQS